MTRLVLAVVIALAGWGLQPDGLWRAAAQDGGAQVVIERPLTGTTTSTQVHISGWAVDPTVDGPGTGIDAVHIYMDGEPGMPRARFLGAASYGQRRADVARALGDERFTNSGFSLLTELPAGTHSLYVYAHSSNAGPQEGWARTMVANVETSLVVAAATMVQPGPTPAGRTSGYTTATGSLQGGNTCLRYNGAGTCETSVPLAIVTGASCIQWNQRGQCVSYLPADGANVGSGTSATGAAPASAGSNPSASALRVPPVASSAARPPGVGAVRVTAPPSADGGENAAAEEEGAVAEGEGSPAGPPQGALPAAAPPSPAEPPAEGAAPAPVVRVAAPPSAPAPAGSGGTVGSGAAAATGGSGDAPPGAIMAGVGPRGLTGTAPTEGAPVAAGGGAPAAVAPLPASGDAPPGAIVRGSGVIPADPGGAMAESPQARATQVALASQGATGTGGVAPLRSGCALYMGCGGEAPQPARPTPNPAASAPVAAPGVSGASAVGAPVASQPSGAPTPTATPTQCPPFAGCGPAAR